MRVTRSGVCHSDLHIWEGYFELGGGKRFYVKERGCVPPFTLGHEPFGIVEAVGPRAPKSLQLARSGSCIPGSAAASARSARRGRTTTASRGGGFLGVTRPGAYSTHVLVPDPKYLVDASGIDESFAATLACSGVTAYSAIREAARRSRAAIASR